MTGSPGGVVKIETGIPGFDAIALGGLPRARSTLLAGTSGTGKTVFAVQFLVVGISRFEENGVFVTCEESPEEIRHNAASLGLDIASWEEQGCWAFVDASPEHGRPGEEAGKFSLDGMLARIEHAVKRIDAKRVSIDSIGSLINRFNDSGAVRRELHRVLSHLKSLDVTLVVTAERSAEEGPVARYGVEEFVSDNVVILRNNHEHRSRRRTIELVKLRGAGHLKGEWPFTIVSGEGFHIVPYGQRHAEIARVGEKISIGQPELDAMLNGGVFRGSTILVSGAPGTGKTLLATHFCAAAGSEDRSLLVSFEESYPQLVRNASGWGFDYEALESRGCLKIVCSHPDTAGPEEQLLRIRRVVEEFGPARIVVDGLSALENSAGEQGKYDFVMGVNSVVREYGLVCLLTSSAASLLGGDSITEYRASTLADVIILLRYAEVYGTIARSITVLKVRGSAHDKELREVNIDHEGMHVGRVFNNMTGVLTGHLKVITDDQLAHTHGMLQELTDS